MTDERIKEETKKEVEKIKEIFDTHCVISLWKLKYLNFLIRARS